MIKKYIYIIDGIVLVFLSAIITISIINRRLKKLVDIRTEQIRKNREEISSLYEELYDKEEELQAQLEELRQSEKKLQELNERLKCLFVYSPDAIVQFDKNHIIMDINLAFEKLFGYSPEECIGRNVDDIVTGSEDKEIAEKLTRELFINGNINTEGIRYTKEGKPKYVKIRAILMKVNEEVVGGYGIYTDITESYEYKKSLEYMSYHDILTGVYNRRYFEEKLRSVNKFPVSIIMADLNGLKLVNDTMGYVEGDRLLIRLAVILSKSIGPSGVLARIGGDEFAILLPNTNYNEADKILKRIRDNINKYNQNEAADGIILSVSLGFATADNEKADLEKVLSQADEMMYRYKLLNSSSIRSQTINVLLSALAEKDYITEGHAKRVKDLCMKIGERLGLSEKELSDLALLAEIHDLGKVAIPDSILNKKGPLDEEEWKIMKQHCEKGYRIALSSPDLAHIADLILKHHERWDGSGYPLGLKDEEIPLACRILSVVDAYDAMTSERPYSKAKSKKEALAEIKNCAGKQFDPKVVEAFLALFE
ncbi:diguanylate cyclase [Thermovorax subterraneus]|nr:diguanylate cyclase [Thermovorax subterraneus]